MQQVAAEVRFWWRTQDASSPEPFTAPPQPTAKPQMLRRPKVMAPAIPTVSLEIARDQRRGKRRASSSAKTTKTRRRLTIIFACTGLTLLTAALGIAAQGERLDVAQSWQALSQNTTSALVGLGFGLTQVNLKGQRYTLDRDVFDAIDVPNVATLWQLDMPAVLRRIERIAWVDKAQITRVFPDSLEITISERTPVALWKRHDGKMLVDATGRVLGPTPANTQWTLPQVAGVGANENISVLLTAVSRHPQIAQAMSYAERIGERRWRIYFTNRSVIELAAEREIEGLDAIAANRTMLDALQKSATIVDVRTPSRITMRPAEQRTANAALPASVQP